MYLLLDTNGTKESVLIIVLTKKRNVLSSVYIFLQVHKGGDGETSINGPHAFWLGASQLYWNAVCSHGSKAGLYFHPQQIQICQSSRNRGIYGLAEYTQLKQLSMSTCIYMYMYVLILLRIHYRSGLVSQ